MTQHVVMTAIRMTQRSCDDTGGDDLLRRMTLRDDRDADDPSGLLFMCELVISTRGEGLGFPRELGIFYMKIT